MSDAYRFGEWLVEPDLNRLSREAESTHLEPLAMDVLVHLLTHHDRVVAADEILDRVWPDRSSDPGMVKKRIAQIRRALDDQASHPLYIETIRKRGYRTVARVARLTAPSGDEAEPEPWSSPVGWPELSILLEAFRITSDDARVRLVMASVTETLVRVLTRYPEMHVVSTGSDGPKGSQTPAYRLTGSAQGLGGETHVVARLVRSSDGYAVWSDAYRVSTRAEVAELHRVATAIGRFVRMEVAKDVQLWRVGQRSRSAQATELVGQGLSEWYGLHQGSGTSDAKIMESAGWSAVALDDALPDGYSLIAGSKTWALYLGELSAEEASRQAHEAIARGLALEPGNLRLLRLRGIIESRMDRDFEAAEASFREAMRVDPLNPDMHLCHLQLARLALYRDDLVAALEHYRRAIRLFEGDARQYVEYACALGFAGHYQESIRAAHGVFDLIEGGLGRMIAVQNLVGVHISVGDCAAARSALDQIAQQDRLERPGLYAAILASCGRVEQARRIWRDLERSGAWIPARQGFHYSFALGGYDDAFRWLHRAIDQRSELLVEYLGIDPSLDVLREDPRWQDLMAHLTSVTPSV